MREADLALADLGQLVEVSLSKRSSAVREANQHVKLQGVVVRRISKSSLLLQLVDGTIIIILPFARFQLEERSSIP
jgi:hypothetical protein